MLEKPAATQFPVHDLIRRRWSPRAFADRRVDPSTLGSLFEAARWAASSSNAQPWRFIVVTKDRPNEFAAFVECLASGNQVWAKQAPVLMLSVAHMHFDDQTVNRHALHDVGQAAANLAIQATALGMVIHQMAGFSMDKARETFRIPSEYEPVAAIAVGYQGQPGTLPERLREREQAPRSRDALESMVFAGTWGHAAGFVTGR